MYAGQVVERGPVGEVFARPLHPYTRALLAAVPEGDAAPAGIPGVVPPPHAHPPGCRFAPRCPRAAPACEAALPALEHVGPSRAVRCRRWAEAA
jgi:peptide/nickel transport system permease protein